MGRASLGITSLWPPRRLSVHVWLGKSPGLAKEKYVIWIGPSLLSQLFCYSSLGVLVHREWISKYFTLQEGVGIHHLPHYGTESFTCGVFPNSKQCQNWGHPVSIHRELEKLLGLKKKKKKTCLVSEVKGSRIQKTGGFPMYPPWLLILKMLSSFSFLLRSLKC